MSEVMPRIISSSLLRIDPTQLHYKCYANYTICCLLEQSIVAELVKTSHVSVRNIVFNALFTINHHWPRIEPFLLSQICQYNYLFQFGIVFRPSSKSSN